MTSRLYVYVIRSLHSERIRSQENNIAVLLLLHGGSLASMLGLPLRTHKRAATSFSPVSSACYIRLDSAAYLLPFFLYVRPNASYLLWNNFQ